ncbi:hypothetical protein SH668x_002654 [Planctomicrobium sp. SH668]|uniref:GspE/PulE/PilB domain-containing protein n=1 Tax=Planctomicrobium sp. SH668 TaxID=3448126 RepID=UPI003F5C2F05
MDFYKEWLGIPEGPRPPDHYELLRVKRFEDDSEKIRAHYKKLNAHVRKYATGQYSVQSQDLLNEMAKAMLCLTDLDRKRDYDESLGREIPPQLDRFGRMPLLDVLVRQNDITREQAREATEFGDRRGLSHRDSVVQMKFVSAEKAAQALAMQLGFSYVDLEDMLPEDDALDMVPRQLVKQHSFIPLFVDDGELLIASVDQIEHELEEELRLRFEAPVRTVIAAPRAVSQAIAKYYAPGARDEAKVSTSTKQTGKSSSGKMAAKSSGKAGSGGNVKAVASKSQPGKSLSFAELPLEEQQKRKSLGMIFMCWSVIVPMLPQILKTVSPALGAQVPISFWTNVVIAVLIGAGVSGWVTQKYWK